MGKGPQDQLIKLASNIISITQAFILHRSLRDVSVLQEPVIGSATDMSPGGANIGIQVSVVFCA